jgi:CO/xanthine dehydrogenase FAD-binding subunit
VKPAAFEYLRPTSLDEALALLHEHGEEAKPLAGGQSLVPLMNFRLARPAVLIDLNRIPGLADIRDTGSSVSIGSMARHADVERSTFLADRLPVLRTAAAFIGHAAIRNWGTFGGSLAHADPAAEWPLVALALGAECVVRAKATERRIPIEALFVDMLVTSLTPQELLCDVQLRVPKPQVGWSFRELSRHHGDFAIAAVVALFGLDASGRIDFVRIAFGGMGPVPVRARTAEDWLLGQRLDPGVLGEGASRAVGETDPSSDIHASAEYRRKVGQVLCEDALVEAAARAMLQSPRLT